MNIKDFVLVKTCDACPEQYDVFHKGNQVGYLRLRHGYFSAEVPNCGGELVYEALPKGDGWFCDDERERFLLAAVEGIEKAITTRADTRSDRKDE